MEEKKKKDGIDSRPDVEEVSSSPPKDRHEWEQRVLRDVLETRPERQEQFRTPSGIPVNRIYDPDDYDGSAYRARIGYPGSYPYTRGVYPTMYRGSLWTRRQVVGLGTAEDTNARHKYVISQGQTGLSNDFDHPTLTGYDSDDPHSRGEVGKIGVAIDSIEDMDDLFKGIDQGAITTAFNINHPAAVILGMYVALGDERNVDRRRLNGTTQNDPLKEFYAQKTFVFPPRQSVRLTVDVLSYCVSTLPNWKAISLTGYQPREAGCNAYQELAFAFGEGIAYTEEALARGLDIDDVAPQITFLFQTHNNLLEEIAKFRAGRRLWARIIRERFGAKNPESCRMRMHVQTGGATLTAQQPYNNIIRGTVQALAAVLGGTQSLAVSCYDEALSIPSEHAQMTSLRIQQILAHESGVTDTVDPLAGSYVIESLTDELEHLAEKTLEDIDSRGGMIAATESGYIEQLISDAAYEEHRRIQNGETTIVGVNEYKVPDDEGVAVETFRVDPEREAAQIQRVRYVRSARNYSHVQRTLDRIREVASGSGNLMPPIVDAAKARATEGEIIGAMKDVFGEHRPPSIF